ncbi:MAG: hypothetical protein WC974_09450 [Thermoplasmata archaeon]
MRSVRKMVWDTAFASLTKVERECTCGAVFASDKDYQKHVKMLTPRRPTAYILCKNKMTKDKHEEAESAYSEALTAHQPVLTEKELNKGLSFLN